MYEDVEEHGAEEDGISNRQEHSTFIPPLTMTVSVRKIIHNEDGTRATLLGSIVPDTTRGAGTGSVPSTKV